MANTNYTRGRSAEWALRKLLEANGALVIRSAGSKGPVDLVAVFPEHVTCYQVKTGRIKDKERDDFRRASVKRAAHFSFVTMDRGMIKTQFTYRNGKLVASYGADK